MANIFTTVKTPTDNLGNTPEVNDKIRIYDEVWVIIDIFSPADGLVSGYAVATECGKEAYISAENMDFAGDDWIIINIDDELSSASDIDNQIEPCKWVIN